MATKPFIVDFGTVTLKVGRAGEKIPPFVAPPLFGRPNLNDDQKDICDFSGGNGNNWLDYAIFPLNPREKHDNTIPVPAITYSNGRYQLSYTIVDKLLESATSSKGVDDIMEGGAVMATEPNLHTPEFRRTMAEILIEGQRVDRFYMCKRAALTCYASGRGSGIVVDVGGACSNVSVVSDGYVIQEAAREEAMGGTLLDRIFLGYLSRAGTTIRPSFEYVKSPKMDENDKVKVQKINNEMRSFGLRKMPYVRQEYYDYARLYATSRVKETCCIIGEKLNVEARPNDSCFALPDGTYLDADMGKSLCGIFCRCLFNEPEYLQDLQEFKAFELENLPRVPADAEEVTLGHILGRFRGLDAMLEDAYTTASQMEPTACLPEALSAIILSGGTTRHPAVLPLLQKRFEKRMPDVEQPLFMAIGGEEQQYSSFIGASIMASLGVFDSLCVSRDECQEHGFDRILQRKCP